MSISTRRIRSSRSEPLTPVLEKERMQIVSSEESDGDNDNDNVDSDSGDSASGTTSVSSVPDATGTVRRKYTRLINTCRKLEKREGFSGDIQAVMTKNIQSAKSLFDELSHGQNISGSASTQRNSSRSEGFLQNLGSGPGDIYMAFLHTKMISDVLKSKTNSIGTSNSGFKLDNYLHSLKRKAVDDGHLYSSKLAAKMLAVECAASCTTLSMLTACVGSFDRDAISVPKERKRRAPIQKKNFEEIEKTQEDVNNAVQKKGKGPEKITHHLNRILRQHTKSQNRATSLYEFVLDPTSLNKSIESIFYVAFLVHDGWAGLHRTAGSHAKDLGIELKPEKRAERPEAEDDRNNSRSHVSNRRTSRSQYILSFSPRMFKQLCQISSGQPIIPSNLADLPDENME